MATDDLAAPDPLLRELRMHPHRGPLGALALDVLGRQAEGRTQFVGREHVRRRAADLGVERDASATSLCNALDLLERGPDTDRERRLVASLAVLGLADAVARDPEGSDALIERAVRHATWLEVATDLSWLSALASQTEGELADRVTAELAQHVLDTGLGPARREPKARASAVALASALAASDADAAATTLSDLTRHAGLDPVVLSTVRALAGAGGAGHATVTTIEGRAASPRPYGVWAALRWVTGWALLTGLVRAVLTLLGREGTVTLAIRGRELEVQEQGGVLGARTQSRTSVVPLSAIVEARRDQKYRGAALYAGALALAVGVLLGGYLLFDGLRSGELVLASLGAALVLGGVLADVGTAWLARTTPEGASMELVLPRGRVVRLLTPSLARTDAFLEALRERLR